MKAKAILKAVTEGDPKDFLRKNRGQGLGSEKVQRIDSPTERAYHFGVGSPVMMTFDIIAESPSQAVTMANAYFEHLLRNGQELNDDRATCFSWDERRYDFRITERQIMMSWVIDSDDDPDINPDFSPV